MGQGRRHGLSGEQKADIWPRALRLSLPSARHERLHMVDELLRRATLDSKTQAVSR